MDLAADIALLAALILLNGLLVVAELALVSANRARLSVMERKGVKGAALARAMSEDPQRFLPTAQVGITIIGILSGVVGGARLDSALEPAVHLIPFLAPFAPTISLALVVLAITFFSIVLGELVPKQLALRHPERIAVVAAPVFRLLTSAARPVVWVLNHASALMLRLLGAGDAPSPAITEEELKALIVEGEETGVLESEERDMIERVLRLADRPVRAIMTPRTDLAWIDRTDPPRDIVQALKSAPHSRFIVCDGRIDNVVGIVQAKDLLDRILDGKELSIPAALRQPMVVPDTVSALDALERLKADALGLALVFDEHGSFEGVITAADVLEAIVGDAETPADADDAETTLALDGATPVDELRDRLELPELPAEGSYHTLGGLVLALLQRVPRPGDRIVFGGWLFEVLEMDGRRVEKVRATREVLAEG